MRIDISFILDVLSWFRNDNILKYWIDSSSLCLIIITKELFLWEVVCCRRIWFFLMLFTINVSDSVWFLQVMFSFLIVNGIICSETVIKTARNVFIYILNLFDHMNIFIEIMIKFIFYFVRIVIILFDCLVVGFNLFYICRVLDGVRVTYTFNFVWESICMLLFYGLTSWGCLFNWFLPRLLYFFHPLNDIRINKMRPTLRSW